MSDETTSPTHRSLADVPYRELAERLRTQSLRQIARHYGVAPHTVRYWRRKLGIPRLPAPTAARPLAPEILAYLATQPAGATTRDLVRVLAEPSASLYNALQALVAAGAVRCARDPDVPRKRFRWSLAS
jgi:transposase-like protein